MEKTQESSGKRVESGREDRESAVHERAGRLSAPEIQFEELEGEARDEIERAAAEAEAHAEAHGATDLVKEIQQATIDAKGEVHEATVSAQEDAGIQIRQETVKKLEGFIDAEIAKYDKEIERLKQAPLEKKHESQQERRLNHLRQVSDFGKRLRSSSAALVAIAGVMLGLHPTARGVSDAIEEHVDVYGVDTRTIAYWTERITGTTTIEEEVMREEIEKNAEQLSETTVTEKTVQEKTTSSPAAKKTHAKKSSSPLKTGVSAVGTGLKVGAGAVGVGFFAAGGFLKGISNFFGWIDKSLGKLFSGKDILGAPERFLNWLGDALEGKTSGDSKKH